MSMATKRSQFSLEDPESQQHIYQCSLGTNPEEKMRQHEEKLDWLRGGDTCYRLEGHRCTWLEVRQGVSRCLFYMDYMNDLYSLEHMQESFGAGGEQLISDDQPSMDPLDGTPNPEGAADSTSHNGRANATSGSAGNKKKLTELSIDGLVHMLEKLHEDTNKRLNTLSLRIGYEFNLSKACKDVFELLGRFLGLTRDQKFDAGEIILEKVEHLDFFLRMSKEDRSAYVLRALAKFM